MTSPVLPASHPWQRLGCGHVATWRAICPVYGRLLGILLDRRHHDAAGRDPQPHDDEMGTSDHCAASRRRNRVAARRTARPELADADDAAASGGHPPGGTAGGD